jgi:hypothetical protein
MIWLLTAGQSHRREANSGGEAECHKTHNFWGKAPTQVEKLRRYAEENL